MTIRDVPGCRRGRAEIDAALAEVFPRASPRSRELLAVSGRISELDPGQAVRAPTVVPVTVVLSGSVVVRLTTGEGRRTIIRLVKGVGLLLLGLSAHDASVEQAAVDEARVVSWPPRAVGRLAEKDVGLANDLLMATTAVAWDLAEQLQARSSGTARARLARVLIRHPDLAFDPVRPRLSTANLGELIGVSREMTDRILLELDGRGIVRKIGRRGLVLLDRERLVELARGSGHDERARSTPAGGGSRPATSAGGSQSETGWRASHAAAIRSARIGLVAAISTLVRFG
jgi:CRP-like cAMP-binding protein